MQGCEGDGTGLAMEITVCNSTCVQQGRKREDENTEGVRCRRDLGHDTKCKVQLSNNAAIYWFPRP